MEPRTVAIGAVGVLMLGLGIGSCHQPVKMEYKTTYVKVPIVKTKIVEKEVVRYEDLPTSCLDALKHLDGLRFSLEGMSNAVGKLNLAAQDVAKFSVNAEIIQMNEALQIIRDEKGRLGSELRHNYLLTENINRSMDRCNADIKKNQD